MDISHAWNPPPRQIQIGRRGRRGVARWRPWKDGGKFDRRDWIHYCASVIGAVVGMVVWFAAIPRTEDGLRDALIGVMFVVASLSSVLAVGVALLGKSKNRLLMEEIRAKQDEMLAKQDETNRLLKIIIEILLKNRAALNEGGRAALNEGGKTAAAARGGGGDSKSRAPV